MPNSFTKAIGDTVTKAKKTTNEYVQAAKDLAAMPGTIRKAVAPYKEVGQALDKADSDRMAAARKKAKGGY